MLKAIIFDFDGVILESVDVKTEAFRELFKGFPDHLDEIIQYHQLNGGISRYVKFEHIYRNILKKGLSDEEKETLARQFSKSVYDLVLDVPYVPGAKEFLDKYRGRLEFFVVSGTPEDELRKIIENRGMSSFFRGVYGSPRKKGELSRMILKNCGFKNEEVVFVGDSVNDWDGAREADIHFIGRRHDGATGLESLPNGQTITDIYGLDQIVKELFSKQ